MPWSIPDKGEALDNAQSILFQEYLDAVIDGINGSNCVLSGLTPTSNANMTIAIAKGSVLSNKIMYAVAGANATIGTADATNPRIDLIVINSAGAITVRAGTAAAAPKPPARTSNDVLVAAIWVPANDTNLATNQIVDLRVLRDVGPICIYRTTTAEVTNTTASAIHILNKAGSGLSIPNGLFLAGRLLRVRIGGNILANNSTPTITLTIIYGGTTMYANVSGATTNDTDRIPFHLDFVINAQANNDQALSGLFGSQILGAKTPPATGLGPIWAATALGGPIAGSAAVDSDAANRLLEVTITLSVSNVNNEVVTEYATVELI